MVDRLRAVWRQKKREPINAREAWLQSPEAIIALGARTVAQLRKDLRLLRIHTHRELPSSTWWDDLFARGIRLPTGWIRSRVTGRKMPPPAIELEDMIDKLSPLRAASEGSTWPASPSAVAIERIALTRGRELRS